MDYYETTYYILNVVILKMCTWVFDGARINFDRFTASKRSHFLAAYSHCRVWSLLINSFLQFSVGVSQTLQTYVGHIGDTPMTF